MPLASHRIRYIVLALVLTWMALVLLPRPAHGAWSADPVEVHATAALCPAVSAADDAHGGALIVWQENTATGGTLDAQHVFANGDLDPAWGAPVALTVESAARVAIGAVSDGAGGAYVWWMQDATLYLTHVTAGGTIASGWSAHGRALGTMPSFNYRPVALADGAGGVYVGWLSPLLPVGSTSTYVRVVHLGPLGLGAGGWPTSGRALSSPTDVDLPVNSFALDRAADGGLWLSWVTVPKGLSMLTPFQPGEIRTLRVTPAGLPADGWVDGGVLIAPFDTEFMSQFPIGMFYQPGSLVAVAHDGGSGAYLVSTQVEWDGSQLVFHPSLRHLDGVGATADGWSSTGLPLADVSGNDGAFMSASASVRAFPDQQGGVLAGVPAFASEFGATLSFSRRSPAGAALPGGIGADQQGVEYAPRGDGGMFIASFKPSGATGPYEADAYISVTQSDPGAGFFESKTSYSATRYGDIGLTATGDGGAIFAWSQLIDRHGVYAIRLGQAGAVTGVTPPPVVSVPSLRVRFVRGEGVRAVARIPDWSPATIALHDVMGRRIASVTSPAPQVFPGRAGVNISRTIDVVLPGTRDLPGGVYFARATLAGSALDAKVIVLP